MLILLRIWKMENAYHPNQCLERVITGKVSLKLMVFGCVKTFYQLINNQTCYHPSKKMKKLGQVRLIRQSCYIFFLIVVAAEGWFAASSSNQAMRFGDLPGWAVELSSSIHEVILFSNYAAELENYETGKEACIFPQDLLWREPIFDQLIVNMYQPAEGICPHVDLMRFEDGIAIVSLESTCVMHFSRVENDTSGVQDPQHKVPVLLTPGCLILMWGEARYLWKHEINRKPGIQIWEGQEIDQKRRISVTLRKLCQTE
ncbi:alkylated DNA repair protein alkB homolog 8 isoform X3 [Capsicum annuum]|uniref:alkylated DNA repair protein alkB homolog 8 isoform X3 n=1 Tax=Capsicum annuum TaxID=4072 RepID=UPI001FB0E13D|nr:alkylated DNA repair protein alkB homolog 8 isoform X3 [Capsicum annuum]